MSKHTAGPWSFEAEHMGQFTVTAPERHYIAGVGAPWDELAEVQEANARLIAAAPDLLEIAQTIKAAMSEGLPINRGTLNGLLMDRLNAALAKAVSE